MKKTCLILAALLCGAFAFAQSAETVSEIVETPAATCGQMSYMALVYGSYLEEDASYSQATEAAIDRGYLPRASQAEKPITLKELSLMCVKATDLNCGLFYRLTGSARYAFKELKARGILDAQADPAMQVSGQNAVAVLNACINASGGQK